MPPSLREWLPEDHLAWFVLDVVDRLDTVALHRRHANDGAGRAAYDPDMLLGVVLYGYAVGVRSSRQLERLCGTDVAFRVLCAQDAPDHSTLSRFITRHADAVTGLFSQVLALCAKAGMVKVGTVAIDGTKIAANASLAASKSRDWLAEQARRIVEEGIATDAAEDAEYGAARGDELPVPFATSKGRAERIEQALRQVEEEIADPPQAPSREKQRRQRAKQRPAPRAEVVATGRRPGGRAPLGTDEVAEAQAAYDRILAERQAAFDRITARDEALAAAGGWRPGRKPLPPQDHVFVRRAAANVELAKQRAAATTAETARHAASQTPKAAALQAFADARKANITDPDSRIMKAPNGFVQGYNAQAAVTDDQIVLAADVTQEHNDHHQLQPMMNAAVDAARQLHPDQPHGGIGCVLADAGYCSDDNLRADGPDRLIAVANLHTLDGRRHSSAPPPQPGTPRADMRDRLTDPDGRQRYKRRSQVVEPVFGQVKEQQRLRKFSRRGLSNVQAEWNLTCLAHNLLKLHRHTATAPA